MGVKFNEKIMRSVLKKMLIVVLVVVGVLVLWALIDSGYQAWEGYKWQKQTDKFQNALEQPYKDDTYGGKTPEETWGMFLDALKKGDIDLASKYYDVGHQAKGREMIEKLKLDNKFDTWVKNLETLKKDQQQPTSNDRLYYSYKYFDAEFKEDLWSPVVFYLNPSTKVWKIVY